MKSDPKLSGLLQVLTGWLAPLFPFASLIPQLPSIRFSNFKRRARCIVLVCFPIYAVGLLQLAVGRASQSATFLGLGITITAFMAFGTTNRRFLFMGNFAFIASMLLGSLLFLQADRSTWVPADSSAARTLVGLLSKDVTIRGIWNSRVAAYRKWKIEDANEPLQIAVKLHLKEGDPDVEWLTSEHLRVNMIAGTANATTKYTRLAFTDPSQFVFRSYLSPTGLASRRFDGHLLIRANEAQNDCGTVELRASGDIGSLSSEALCVTSEWQAVDLAAQVPFGSEATRLDLVVAGFASTIEVADASLAETSADGIVSLLPLMPTGVALRLSWNTKYPWERVKGQEVSTRAIPTEDGEVLSLSLPRLPAGTTVWGALHVEDNIAVSISSTQWNSRALSSVNTVQRASLFYDHPNIFAHAVTASAAAALITAPTAMGAMLPIALASVVVITTGSRTALAALVLSSLSYLILTLGGRLLKGRRSRALIAALTITLLLATAGLLYLWLASVRPSPGTPKGTPTDSLAVRTQIWQFAFQNVLEHPVLGVRGSFANSWRTVHTDQIPVSHAHNGLLDAAFQGGLPGALAVLWALACVLILTPRRWRTQSVVALTALITLNLTDSTFFAPTVLAPLLLALLAREKPKSEHNISRNEQGPLTN